MARRVASKPQTAPSPVPSTSFVQSQEEKDRLANTTQKWTACKTKRATLDAEMWLIERFVRPNTLRVWTAPQFQTTALRKKTDEAYDPTAIFANENFAAGIHAFTSSKTEKWFRFGSYRYPLINKMPEAKRRALAKLEDLALHYFNLPASQFHTTMHECNLDNGAFGTSVAYGFWNDEDKCNTYMSMPFPACYLDENANGKVDTIFISTRKSARQVQQIAGLNRPLPPSIITARPEQFFELRYGVFPTNDTNPAVGGITKKRFTSVWWLPADNAIIKAGGYDEFPYFTSRFIKYPGDVYGVGPAMNALPFIKAVNVMMKDYLISGALNLRAPWWMEDDSLIPPYDQFEPGELLLGNPGSKPPTPIGPPGKLEYGERMLAETRDWIQRFFYLDYLIREQKKERQSQLEINDERDQMLRQLNAFVERLQSERFDSLIRWHVKSMIQHKLVPDEILEQVKDIIDEDLCIIYLGQATRAQTSWKAANQLNFLETVLPLGQQFPEAFDRVDVSKIVMNLAIGSDVEQDCIRSEDEAQQLAKQRNDAQQAELQAKVAQPVATAAQKMAQARQLDRT